jgi:hypothetical protein
MYKDKIAQFFSVTGQNTCGVLLAEGFHHLALNQSLIRNASGDMTAFLLMILVLGPLLTLAFVPCEREAKYQLVLPSIRIVVIWLLLLIPL